MRTEIDNTQEGCPPLSVQVIAHIRCIAGDAILWDTVLRCYGGSGEIRVRGKYGEIGDKMDYEGKIFSA